MDFAGKQHTILVVDDNTENIRTIGSILREHNYQVGFALGGKQALDLLDSQDQGYDLVLLDINMPDMNGYDVCKEIRNRIDQEQLPIIFLTAYSEPGDIVQGFKSGGQDYVTKPFHAEELLSRINTHIALKESRTKLAKANEFLEKKVRARTWHLEKANKQLELAKQELESLDRAKADFINLISHEINTPLNGIVGFTYLLEGSLKNTEYEQLIGHLSKSVKRLNEFAQTSLTITKMRTSPKEYTKENVDVSDVVEKVVSDQKEAIEAKGLRVTQSNSSVSTLVEGSKDLLEACMLHIIDNAINYTPNGKEINIKIFDEGIGFVVVFEDNGPGFSEKALETLFQPFAPGEQHIDNNKGLSLALTKMILDFHHADIFIKNREEGGAKVSLIFKKELTRFRSLSV